MDDAQAVQIVHAGVAPQADRVHETSSRVDLGLLALKVIGIVGTVVALEFLVGKISGVVEVLAPIALPLGVWVIYHGFLAGQKRGVEEAREGRALDVAQLPPAQPVEESTTGADKFWVGAKLIAIVVVIVGGEVLTHNYTDVAIHLTPALLPIGGWVWFKLYHIGVKQGLQEETLKLDGIAAHRLREEQIAERLRANGQLPMARPVAGQEVALGPNPQLRAPDAPPAQALQRRTSRPDLESHDDL